MSEDQSSAFPTPEQVDALTVLKWNNNQEILAWITFARSIQSDFQPIDNSGALDCLSNKQVTAIAHMREIPEERLLTWLKLARPTRMSTPVNPTAHNQN